MQLNKIYNDDCISILNDSNKIFPNSIQVVFADPPYNLSGNGLKSKDSTTGGDFTMVNEDWDKMEESEFINFTNEWVKSCKKILKPNGSIFIACSYHNIGESIMSLKANGFEVKNIVTWNKSNAMPNLTRRVLTHTTEFIIWAVKGKGWVFNYEKLKELNPDKKKDGAVKQMRDIWTMPLCQGRERLRDEDGKKALHPTQKPEELLKRIILGFSNENDVILDPFAGSGTTPYIAKKYNRNFIAIEKEKKYFCAIEERVCKTEIKKPTQYTKQNTTKHQSEQDYLSGLFGFSSQDNTKQARKIQM